MSYNPFSLEGKTILITGASSGIGKATAIECSKLGARVIITGRNKERLNETFSELEGEAHQSYILDLTNYDELIPWINSIEPLDGVVLCAGVGYTLPVKFSSVTKFKEIFEINLFSPTELNRCLFKQKKLKEGASIVFISSVGGNIAFNPGNAIYGASKAALNSYMKFCAVEFAPRLIRVNSICPGMIHTPLIRRGAISDEQLQQCENSYPLKRFGTPKEIALGAIYLLSDASSWVTGTSLQIEGGGSLV